MFPVFGFVPVKQSTSKLILALSLRNNACLPSEGYAGRLPIEDLLSYTLLSPSLKYRHRPASASTFPFS